MEIDVKKILGKTPKDAFEAVEQMNKAQQEVLEALHIMQSTIENFEDKECLQLNKERMVKYFNKFAKDEILSK
jgi:predicted XRE-type DNA-binding protein